ncbi:hypothetical protein GCM10020369_72740 [Cryptosporangium minutisporangium]|uniref:Uncharacterized protein n=1 Tax=Cryptosporangium minutisporangium TaxID=113569 RepID=A0ABP6TAA8_9ACTN
MRWVARYRESHSQVQVQVLFVVGIALVMRVLGALAIALSVRTPVTSATSPITVTAADPIQ